MSLLCVLIFILLILPAKKINDQSITATLYETWKKWWNVVQWWNEVRRLPLLKWILASLKFQSQTIKFEPRIEKTNRQQTKENRHIISFVLYF